jgi:hypothetical protein
MSKFTRTLEVFADMVKAGDRVMVQGRERIVATVLPTNDDGVVLVNLYGQTSWLSFYFDEYVAVISK